MTSINNVNVHLTVIFSLRVPPLLANNLSNLDVIPILFNSVFLLPSACFSLSLPLSASNLTTASLFL